MKPDMSSNPLEDKDVPSQAETFIWSFQKSAKISRTDLEVSSRDADSGILEESINSGDVPSLLQNANKGDASAQYWIGRCYEQGYGVPQSYKRAVNYYRLAAGQGVALAFINLALLVQNGQGVKQCYKEAMKLFHQAAKMGNESAYIYIGSLYECGHGVAKSVKKALFFFNKAIRAGYTCACCYVGDILMEQGKVKLAIQEYQKAIRVWTSVADNGDSWAQVTVGKLWAKCENDQSVEKAIKYYTSAAKQGHPLGLYQLAECYANGIGVEQSDEMAISYYRAAAKKGLSDAIYDLALLLHSRDRYEEAFRYWKLYSELQKGTAWNRARALQFLGEYFEEGLGVEKHAGRAHKYFKIAFMQYQALAEQGDSDALVSVGHCYKRGRGVEKDLKKSFLQYQAAAERRDPYALYELGGCFYWGFGVREDDEKALYYFLKACDQNLSAAFYHAGCVFRYLGRSSEAIVYFKKYIQFPDRDHLQEARACQYLAKTFSDKTPESVQNARYYSERAFSIFKLLADRGNPFAPMEVANCFRNGLGVEVSLTDALYYCRLAINRDSKDALPLMASLLHSAGKYEEALSNWEKVLETKEDSLAMDRAQAAAYLADYFELGLGTGASPEKAKKYSTQALRLYESLAEGGNEDAQYIAAQYYQNGTKTTRSIIMAEYFYRLAALQGHQEASHCLAELLDANGRNAEAFTYWKKYVDGRTKQDLKQAQYYLKLAERYFHGIGVEVSRGQMALYCCRAFAILNRAAEEGNKEAFLLVGDCYKNGTGTGKSLEKARHYYQMAVDQGLPGAAYKLQKCIAGIQEPVLMSRMDNDPMSTPLKGSEVMVIFTSNGQCAVEERFFSKLRDRVLDGTIRLKEANGKIGTFKVRFLPSNQFNHIVFSLLMKKLSLPSSKILQIEFKKREVREIEECHHSQNEHQAA